MDKRFQRLDAAQGAPLYEVVKRQLAEAILMGQWTAGEVLPSETALAGEFGISVGTMRRALLELTQEGLVMRRRKTGTVVTGRAPHHNLKYFFQYYRLHDRQGQLLRSTTQWQTMERGQASQREARLLECQPDDPVWRLARLRLIEGRPVMHETMALVAARVPGFPETLEALPELLYRYLFETLGIRIAAVREQIRAELATEQDCRALEIDRPHAIMVIDEVSFDQSSQPVLIAHHRLVTDDFLYVNEIR
ncbi:GntR family transcriptional regulator [Salinicola acroporae]|uniref:GntR family transcriptional regulator n=1 Tax=Salinicola acroporae TaxID=1541440 RepID=A0ABT6I3L0_9GAMM|nr:GntR family transcriptional regulator [Salinicola acroporae]MDH4572274.1 GntR family transcriptional regulator [Salinicola acroporae]